MAYKIDQIDRALAGRSFHDFVRQAWPVLEPQTPFLDTWHLRLICEYLEACAAGEITRLIINVSPRSGKSLLATVLFPDWVWPQNPGERFMFASYSSVLSTKHSVDRRTLIQSPWYRKRWGAIVRLADDLNQKTEFANTRRGHMIATSVGASATGRGGNFLIADDLINPQQASSEAERNAAIRWYDEVFSTRLDDKRSGRMLVIEQRTHQADLTGHLLEQGGWTHVSLPAIAERKATIVFPRSGRKVVREAGDLLWPAREGRAELEAVKMQVGSFAFASQFQQAPVSREGRIIKAEWLTETYRAGELPPKFDSIVMSLDTAFKTGASNDYSALVVIGNLRHPRDGHAPGHYLLDAWRGKVEFPELKRTVLAFQQKWNAHRVLVEDAASGQSLIQELRVNTTLPVTAVKSEQDKLSRTNAVSPGLEAHLLKLPDSASWRDDFIAELTSFPDGAHDDWVDALVQALNHLRGNAGFEAFTTLLKLGRVERLRQEGLTVDEIARELDLSKDVVQRHVDDINRRNSSDAEDDPGARWEACAKRLIEAHRAGSQISIDPGQYKSYIRHRLLTSTDPDAASLMKALDQQLNIS